MHPPRFSLLQTGDQKAVNTGLNVEFLKIYVFLINKVKVFNKLMNLNLQEKVPMVFRF